MFAVPKHIALKMVMKSKYVLQTTFIKFYKRHFKTAQTKKPQKSRKNVKYCTILGSRTLAMD